MSHVRNEGFTILIRGVLKRNGCITVLLYNCLKMGGEVS